MTHLQRATEDLVTVRPCKVSGGELVLKQAPRRADQFYYQGKRIDAATATRLGW